jgi:hypothetical protein
MFTGQKGRKVSEYPGYRAKIGLVPSQYDPQHLFSLSLTRKQFPADAKAEYTWWLQLPYFLYTFHLHVLQ